MTYKTSDIIRRAKQLADLENSDFISYEENLMLINECYNKLYEKLINHNDKAFIRSAVLTGFSKTDYKTVYTLPEDFWQLYGVRASVSNIPIPRKAQSESDTTSSYDIVNNELIIYGNRINDPLILDYWERPPTLTYPRKATRIDTGLSWLAVYGSNAVARDPDDSNYKMYDLDGNMLHDFNLASCYQAIAGKNAAAILNSGAPYTIDIYRKGTQVQETDVLCAWVNHGIIYYCKMPSAGTVDVYTQNNILSYSSHVTMPDDYTDFLFVAKDWAIVKDSSGKLAAVYYDRNGSITAIENKTAIDEFKFIMADTPVLCEGNNVFFIDTESNVSCYDTSLRSLFTLNEDYDAVCLAWQGEKSGYGYINSSGALCSFYPDTILDFTNNFYFTLMAYYLAIAYKSKQNADTAALSTLAAEAEDHFYDTIGRDAYNVTRIRNAYA